MRHLGSVVLSLIGVVALPLLVAVGLAKVLAAGVDGGRPLDRTLLAEGLVYLAVAGLLYGVLMVMRFSPIGLFLGGVLLAAGSLLVMTERSRVLSHLPDRILGQTDVQVLATAPFVLVLAVPMLLSLFSAWRWRRRTRPEPITTTEPLPVSHHDQEVQPHESWRPA